MELKRPSCDYKISYLAAYSEMQTQSDRHAWIYMGDAPDLELPKINFDGYVQAQLARETQRPPNFVCDTIYWAISNDEVVGRIALRHELNDFLKNIGGHIGYIVRPSARGKGIATEMLRLVLQTERARQIGKLLVTCDPSNVVSERTILKNGGVYENNHLTEAGRVTKRFWITVTKMGILTP